MERVSFWWVFVRFAAKKLKWLTYITIFTSDLRDLCCICLYLCLRIGLGKTALFLLLKEVSDYIFWNFAKQLAKIITWYWRHSAVSFMKQCSRMYKQIVNPSVQRITGMILTLLVGLYCLHFYPKESDTQ